MNTGAVAGLAVVLCLVCVAVAVLIAVIFTMRWRMINKDISSSGLSNTESAFTNGLQT